MNIKSKTYNHDLPEIVTFPGASAELDTQTIKELKLGSALTRLGNALIKQTRDSTHYDAREYKSVPAQCVGVKIASVTVQFVYQEINGPDPE